MVKPLVSIIVYSRNSEVYIGSTLESLKNQTYKNIEIIVVDNNSADSTKTISALYTNKIYNWGPERIHQVNFGVEKSSGKYVFWKGTNAIVEPDFIEQAVKVCEDNSCDAVYLNVLTKVDNPNIWQKVRALERTCYYKEPGMSSAKFCKKSVFLQLGGLDIELGAIADDLEFQYRLDLNKFKTCFIDANIYYLREYNSIKKIIIRSLYYGLLLYRYYKKHPLKFRIQYRPVRKEFKRKMLLKNKFIFIVFIIYKIIQYFFGGIGFFLAKITKNNARIEELFYKINFGAN